MGEKMTHIINIKHFTGLWILRIPANVNSDSGMVNIDSGKIWKEG